MASLTGERYTYYPDSSSKHTAYRAWGTLEVTDYDTYVHCVLYAYLTLGTTSSSLIPRYVSTYETDMNGSTWGHSIDYTTTSSAQTFTVATRTLDLSKTTYAYNASFSVSSYPVLTSQNVSNVWPPGTSSASVTITVPALATFNLYYDTGGGNPVPSSQTFYYGQNFTVSSTQPTRSGYIFRGWTDGSTQYSSGGTYTDSKHTSLTLYAIWHQNPTITTKSISSPGPYYKGLTNCSVTYSGASASDGASFSVETKVGSKFSRTSYASSDTLSVVPQETGNVPVTITIIDSLNASTSYSLPNITVNQYVAPSVVVSAERTTEYGLISNDSNDANAGLIITTFTVPSQAGYPMGIPTVTLTRSDGVTSTPTVEWYYYRDSTTKEISGPFYNWGGITNGTVYGIIKNCNPNYAYQVNITPTDSNNGATKVTKTTIIPPLFYTIDFLAGGKGIAFGAAAVNDGFYCKMDTTFGAGIYIELDTGQSSSIDSQLSTAIGNLGWNSGTNPVIAN